MPYNTSHDGTVEGAMTQLESTLKRFRCYLLIAGAVSFLLAAVVCIVLTVRQSPTAGNSSGNECTGNNPINTECIVPECARVKYEELKAIYPSLPDYDVTRSLAGDDCPAELIAANALAIRWTRANNDEMEDIDVYFALATIYFSLRGDGWRSAQNWMQPSPMCEWHGVNCTKDKDGKKDVIVALSLPDNQMVGDVPSQLGLLTSLQSLSLAGNNLGGTSMPSEIGRLVDLKTLDLRSTTLAGQLPSEIGLCTKLTMLDLEGSALSGSIPTEIGTVESLESLTVGSVFLAGPLPTEIGQLSRLTTLWVFVLSNTDEIAIPSEVTLLSNIRTLYLDGVATPSNTWLTDAFVAMTDLTSLSVVSDANRLGHNSSTLPTHIGRLTALESVAFLINEWTGTLPTELARLTKLTSLELWSNRFSGTIPTELGLLTDLVVLDMSDNYADWECAKRSGCTYQTEFCQFRAYHVVPANPSRGLCPWIGDQDVKGPH
ncbi:transmembrane receptor protein serine/threonine kinase [Fragilaria crotonensis]|nr:transmembrane receptor protein serine/threonine kinase [Fragilaria crotonensis]